MEPDLDPNQQRRASCLPWLLGAMVLAGGSLVLSIATGGFFFCFIAMVLLLGTVLSLHYALWGQALNNRAAREREEERRDEPPDSSDGFFRPEEHVQE